MRKSLEKILRDGGCAGIPDCHECALYRVSSAGCDLESEVTRKKGTEKQFSLSELAFVQRRLKAI